MPLVILTGMPCVGKTSFAQDLAAYLSSRVSLPVIIVNEESLGITKSEAYCSEFQEKKTRGALRSAVDHALNPSTYVMFLYLVMKEEFMVYFK